MSKTIAIEVIDVATPTFVKTAKGGYNIVEIAYKEDGKVSGKKIVDFANPEVYKAVLELKAKDAATVVIEKEAGRDGKEYWQWKSVTPGAIQQVSDSTAQSASSTPSARTPAGRVTGSNYETAEERAAKQVYIVRQSSITAALKYFEQTNADVTVNDVITLAETFKEFVFNGHPIKAKQATSAAAGSASVPAANPEGAKVVGRPKKQTVAEMDEDIPF